MEIGTNGQGNSRRSKRSIIAIASVAAALLLVSYLYSTYTTNLIATNAAKDIQQAARIQANDVSKILQNKIESISSNLLVISESQRIRQESIELAAPLFTVAQQATSDFTDSYFWIDKDGKLIWASSFSNATIKEQFAGADRNDRTYYTSPKETHMFYISSTVRSVDGVPRIYFSYPIIDRDSVFKGVVVASANLHAVGNFLESQLSPETPYIVGLVSKDGVVFYTPNEQNIGKNMFGDEFQNTIPEGFANGIDELLKESLGSGSSGYSELSSNDQTATIAYQPVVIQGSTFAVLYIIAPHNFAEETAILLDNQRYFSIIMILAISGVAIGIGLSIARWNNKLTLLVGKRTGELKAKTQELQESNSALEGAYKQLEIHDRLQKEFVNIAAHELRTPIQPLLGAAELLESQFENNDEIRITRPEIEMIVRNAKRLERLSSDILEMARIESNAMRLNKEKFSLSYIIADAVKDAKAQSIYNPDKLKIAYAPDEIFVYADREKIIQVISNLLTNALKFTEDGTITITTTKDVSKQTAVITVKDTGTGIDPEVLPRLFEKFVTKSEKGTGIGLYISRKIVEIHGGTISGENNKDSTGAKFSFSLPLASESQTEHQREEQQNSERK